MHSDTPFMTHYQPLHVSAPPEGGNSVPKRVGIEIRSGYVWLYYTDLSYCIRTTQSHNIATPTHQRTSIELSQTCRNIIQTSEIENNNNNNNNNNYDSIVRRNTMGSSQQLAIYAP
jgi:hypothetical protein